MTEQNQQETATQPVVADPSKNTAQVRTENERLSNTEQVVITHPENPSEGKVSRKQFEKIWKGRGWTVVEDGTGATPDQIDTGAKEQASFDETVEKIPEATTNQRPGRPGQSNPKEN